MGTKRGTLFDPGQPPPVLGKTRVPGGFPRSAPPFPLPLPASLPSAPSQGGCENPSPAHAGSSAPRSPPLPRSSRRTPHPWTGSHSQALGRPPPPRPAFSSPSQAGPGGSSRCFLLSICADSLDSSRTELPRSQAQSQSVARGASVRGRPALPAAPVRLRVAGTCGQQGARPRSNTDCPTGWGARRGVEVGQQTVSRGDTDSTGGEKPDQLARRDSVPFEPQRAPWGARRHRRQRPVAHP